MSKFKTLKKVWKSNKRDVLVILFEKVRKSGLFDYMPDEKYLKMVYKNVFGHILNLDNPVTYSQKLQWLKLYDHNPLYIKLVDKYDVKTYVSKTIGEEYVVPTYGVWNTFDEIDFEMLPDQFVLKCTHDSGSIFLCKNKNELILSRAKKQIEKCMKKNLYTWGREWPYKDIKPRIIAEKYLEDDEQHELRDYKFFCFDGQVKAMFVATDRQDETTDTKFDFFDKDYNHLPIKQGHPNAEVAPQKPVHFELMKLLAVKLSGSLPQARVDFYECNGQVYFGEITFFHFSGFMPFVPSIWDETFGNWILLPRK